MATIEKVVFHTESELEFITGKTIKDDVTTASHLAKLDRQIKALKAERDKIAFALFDKWEHKKPENSVFHVSVYDYFKLNEKEFKAKYPQLYEELKTLLVHVEKVSG